MTGAARTINARLEAADTKPTYRRCVIPATGYYEWQERPGQPKQPYFIHPTTGLLALAGFYEWWKNPDPRDDPARWVLSTTILTTTPTPGLAPIHDRMPHY